MENIITFLLIMGILIIGYSTQQVKKEAKKRSEQQPHTPIPDIEYPIPENWDDIILEESHPKVTQTVTQAERKKNFSSVKSIKNPSISKPISPIAMQKSEAPSEFAIHSVEEVRRAIIWSEILQRKF